MRSNLILIVGAALAAGPGMGQEPAVGERGGPRTARPAMSYLSVDREAKGPPILVVRYPWQATHSRPSIELRALAEDETDGPAIRPLKFVELFLQGKTTVALYEARDRAWDLPVTYTFTERGRALEITGRRNQLGKPSSVVVFPGLSAPAHEKSQEDMVPRAVYCLLDSWAFDSRTLRLELPSPSFKKASRIRVWFFREGNIAWSETVRWPGNGEAVQDKGQIKKCGGFR